MWRFLQARVKLADASVWLPARQHPVLAATSQSLQAQEMALVALSPSLLARALRPQAARCHYTAVPAQRVKVAPLFWPLPIATERVDL